VPAARADGGVRLPRLRPGHDLPHLPGDAVTAPRRYRAIRQAEPYRPAPWEGVVAIGQVLALVAIVVLLFAAIYGWILAAASGGPA
jgi:hypothetical protein